MKVLDIKLTSENGILNITIQREHDRGNIRRYTLLQRAILGYDVEGEGTDHTYIVLYMHSRNIRFEIPRDASKQEVILDFFKNLISYIAFTYTHVLE
jgi:hypothetical protein